MNAQYDYRMTRIYQNYLETLFNNSVKLANLYTDIGFQSKYGSWGLF